KLLEGDVLTHLNGRNARLLDFSDILKACRGPERGGLPRPLVMKFSRSEALALSPPASPAPSPSLSSALPQGKDVNAAAAAAAAAASKSDTAGGGGATSGASSLLADLDDFMGGLSSTAAAAAAAAGGEARRIPGMSHIK
ncbi:unnamed protein product, partial [Hapterophycus canaliculatus]